MGTTKRGTWRAPAVNSCCVLAGVLLAACHGGRAHPVVGAPRSAPTLAGDAPDSLGGRAIAADSVSAVAFERTGRLFATGAENGLIVLRDGRTGAVVRALKGHTGRITGLAFSPDGATLASSSKDATGRLWDVASGRDTTPGGAPPPSPKEHQAEVNGVAWSPRGDMLAMLFEDNGVHVYEPKSGNLRAVLWPSTGVETTALAFRGDGSTLAVGARNGKIDLWNARRGMRLSTFSAHAESVTSLAFSPDGNTLASAAEDTSIHLYGVLGGSSGDVRPAPERPRKDVRTVLRDTFVAWSPDGKWLASGDDDGAVRLFNPDTYTHAEGVVVQPASGGRGATPVAWSPLGKLIVAGRKSGGLSLVSGAAVDSPPAAPAALEELPARAAVVAGDRDHVRGRVNSVAWSRDGKWLAAATMDIDCEVKVYDDLGELHSTLVGRLAEFPWSVAFSPDGKTLGRSTSRGTLELFELATQKLRAKIKLGDRQSSVLDFSPDGTTVASDTGIDAPGVLLSSAQNGAPLGKLESADCGVRRVRFTPDGSSLVVYCGAPDGVRHWVELWDWRGKRRIAARTPNGELGAPFFDPTPKVWVLRDAPAAKAKPAPKPKKSKKHGYSSAAPKTTALFALDLVSGAETPLFALSGQAHSATSDERGNLVFANDEVWDVKTRTRLRQGFDSSSERDVEFSPDGSRLAIGRYDSTVRIYDPRTGNELLVLGGE